MANIQTSELLMRIDDLQKAFGNVLDSLEKDSKFDEMISDGYPFELSFDEQYLKVIEWNNRMKEVLK